MGASTKLTIDSGETIEGPSNISNLLNEYFASIGTNMAKAITVLDEGHVGLAA